MEGGVKADDLDKQNHRKDKFSIPNTKPSRRMRLHFKMHSPTSLFYPQDTFHCFLLADVNTI